MRWLFRLSAILALVLALAPNRPGQAQDIQTERVAFAAGTSRTVIEDSIERAGRSSTTWWAPGGPDLLGRPADLERQRLFQLMPAGSDEALFIGSPAATSRTCRFRRRRLRDPGLPDAQRRAPGRDRALFPDDRPGAGFRRRAGGRAGLWQVTGLGGALNLRGGPGTRYAVSESWPRARWRATAAGCRSTSAGAGSAPPDRA